MEKGYLWFEKFSSPGSGKENLVEGISIYVIGCISWEPGNFPIFARLRPIMTNFANKVHVALSNKKLMTWNIFFGVDMPNIQICNRNRKSISAEIFLATIYTIIGFLRFRKSVMGI